MPDEDFEVEVSSWRNVLEHNNASVWESCYKYLSEIKDGIGGVYYLKGSENQYLYIGRSVNVKERIISHLVGTSQATRKFKKDILYVSGFYVDDIADQEIYEAYAIKIFQPKYNKAKTPKVLGNYGRYPSKRTPTR